MTSPHEHQFWWGTQLISTGNSYMTVKRCNCGESKLDYISSKGSSFDIELSPDQLEAAIIHHRDRSKQ